MKAGLEFAFSTTAVLLKPLEWEDSCIGLGSVKGFASIPWETLTIL